MGLDQELEHGGGQFGPLEQQWLKEQNMHWMNDFWLSLKGAERVDCQKVGDTSTFK